MNNATTPPSIGTPGGNGGPGGGGSAPCAIDTKPMKQTKIEANIFLFCILLNMV